MTQLFTVASDAPRVLFHRSKLQRLLSLDLVEVLSLIQHNLYSLSFSVPLRKSHEFTQLSRVLRSFARVRV